LDDERGFCLTHQTKANRDFKQDYIKSMNAGLRTRIVNLIKKSRNKSLSVSEIHKNLIVKFPKITKNQIKRTLIDLVEIDKKRKLEGKNGNRYLAVDLNPELIGFCVIEKLPENQKNGENNGFKIIHKGCINLQNLNTKKRHSSTDKKQIYQNNKRKFEICEAWQYIFRLAIHYKISHFVCEDLSFKQENHNENSNFANQKTKNIWHRTLTSNLITKYCNSLGIEKVEVISAFSSFVGNMQYSDFAPIASSLEIARRGIVRYLKGSSIFPSFSNKDKDTMCQIFGLDVPCDTLLNWKCCFELFRTSGLRYRRVLDKTKILDSYLFSYKSCIKLYTIL
jgi:hypothetical protein